MKNQKGVMFHLFYFKPRAGVQGFSSIDEVCLSSFSYTQSRLDFFSS